MDKTTLLDRLRAWPWLALALLATAVVAWIAPHQVGVLVWSLSKACFGAYLGYWIDRSLFPGARPRDIEREANLTSRAGGLEGWRLYGERADRARYRRALVVAAVVLALGLGV